MAVERHPLASHKHSLRVSIWKVCIKLPNQYAYTRYGVSCEGGPSFGTEYEGKIWVGSKETPFSDEGACILTCELDFSFGTDKPSGIKWRRCKGGGPLS